MTVYVLVWISIIVLGYIAQSCDFQYDGILTVGRRKHTKLAKFFFVLASVVLIVAAGCRYRVGTDFGAYYNYRQYLGFWKSLRALEEPGIRLIYDIATRIRPTGQFCIFSVAAVTLGLELFLIFRNTDRIALALVLFTFMCWTACFNGVRQALAVAVLFCGFPALRDKNFKSYALAVFMAFLCHRSAIVMVLVYFIANREVNLKNLIILVVASVIVLLSYGRVYQVVNIVLENTVKGTETYWSTRVNRLRPIIRVAPVVFFLLVNRNKRRIPVKDFYLNILMIGAVVSFTTMNSAALSRMSMYTAPFSVIALVELVKTTPRGNQKTISILMAVLYGIVEWAECDGVPFTLQHLRWFW